MSVNIQSTYGPGISLNTGVAGGAPNIQSHRDEVSEYTASLSNNLNPPGMPHTSIKKPERINYLEEINEVSSDHENSNKNISGEESKLNLEESKSIIPMNASSSS